MHARYYSPGIGRFLSVDPVGANYRLPQSWNRYAYVMNNPLKYVDPLGLQEEEFDEEITVCVQFSTGLPCGFNFVPTSVASLVFGSHNLRNIAHLSDLDREFSIGASGSFDQPTVRPTVSFPGEPTATPDFVSLTVSFGSLVGITSNLTVDRNGLLTFGLGPNVGKSFTGLSGSLTGGGIDRGQLLTLDEINNPSTVTSNFTAAFGLAFGVTQSGLRGQRSGEFGIGSPQIGVSMTFELYRRNLGISW